MFKNLKNSFRSLAMLIKKYPLYLVLEIFSAVCMVVQTIVPIKVTELIVESVTTNPISIEQLTIKILLYMGALAIATIINRIIQYAFTYIKMNFTVYFSTLLYKKLGTIDYSFHENNSFLDNYTRALETGAERIYNAATLQATFIKNLIQSFSIFAILFQIHYSAVVYSVAIGIAFAILFFKSGRINFAMHTKLRPFYRKRNYISRMYFVKDSIADIKTTDIDDVMLNEHREVGAKIVNTFTEYTKKRVILQTIGEFLIATIYPVVLGIVAYFTIEGLAVSSLASLTVAAGSLSRLIVLMATGITQIQNEALECGVPFTVLSTTSKIEGVDNPDVKDQFSELRLDDVTFSYTDQLPDVLSNVNMYIKKGEKIAIVGENGAGKTTLVKLLLRLYDAKKGSISINGDDYRTINTKSLRRELGAVFQNNEVYSVSVAENILLRRIESEEDENLVIEALKFADIYDYVAKLENGIHTIVTREFHNRGMIFSGGQIQKIAVARGYAQNYQLLILDEPSSSLDPIAEAKMYHNMLELGRDRSLIFISHRLSATANVDRVYLFSNGKIIESGTHKELMELGGVYYQMFTSQAQKYIGEDND